MPIDVGMHKHKAHASDIIIMALELQKTLSLIIDQVLSESFPHMPVRQQAGSDFGVGQWWYF